MKAISGSPALREEARRFLPSLVSRAKTASREDLTRKFARHALAFGITDRAPGEWNQLLGIYHEVLGKLPEEAIDEAFRAWGRNELYPKDPGRHAFFPKPNELFALADRAQREIQIACYRAKKAMEKIEGDKPFVKKPEDAAKISSMLADFKAKPMPTPKGPRQTQAQIAAALRAMFPAPAVGASGLTPLMRSKMGLPAEAVVSDEPVF